MRYIELFETDFDNWFKGSKVVTTDGKPLAVYHGASDDFNTFDPKKTRYVEDRGAFFFTNYEGIAQAYADEHMSGVLITAYLSLKNPLIIHATENTAIEEYDYSNGKIITNAINTGKDGIMISDNHGEVLYVVFKPNQIKIISKK